MHRGQQGLPGTAGSEFRLQAVCAKVGDLPPEGGTPNKEQQMHESRKHREVFTHPRMNEEKVEMDFRRVRRGVCVVAIHEPDAHEPAGRAGARFDGHQRATTANRRAVTRRVL